MAEADTALGKFSQQYGDRALTVEPADGGYVFVRVAVKGPRSDAIRELETIAAGTRQQRGLDELLYALRRAH